MFYPVFLNRTIYPLNLSLVAAFNPTLLPQRNSKTEHLLENIYKAIHS